MGIIFDKKYQTMPDMPPVQFQALKRDIEERGLLTPIDIDEEGHILDGHQRYQAMVELGITDFPTIVRPGMSEEEKRLYSRKTNMMRRHLGAKQIRQLIRAQLLETPQWANNRIAQELGVDSKTVKTQRAQLEATSEIPKLTEFEGADGKVRKQRSGGIFATSDAELDKLLKHLAKHGIQDIETFMSASNIIRDSKYNPYYGLDAEQANEWNVFIYYLWKRAGWSLEGAGAHFEWLRDKDFKTPDEWLGPVGMKWARSVGMKGGTDKQCTDRCKRFADFLGENREHVETFITEMKTHQLGGDYDSTRL